MDLYIFPFDKLIRDAKIIIYGAGTVGQSFLRQVQMTQFCHVIYMVDKNFSQYTSLPIAVKSPNALYAEEYDYIIIAVAKETIGNEIVSNLVDKYNVSREKIVFDIKKWIPAHVIRDDPQMIPLKQLAFSQNNKYPFAIKLTGGLGDIIIRKRNVQEVADWYQDILIDIYVSAQYAEFVKTLMSDVLNINYIINSDIQYYLNQKKYIMSMNFAPYLMVDHINTTASSKLPIPLQEKLQYVMSTTKEYGLNSDWKSLNIHYNRCAIDGYNCYTSYNRYKAFHVKESHTTIPLLKQYLSAFSKLKLGQYVTLNYGSGRSDNMASNTYAAKVWPIEYFSQLAKLIKQKFPSLNIVQIGLDNTPKMEYCSHHILGENLELIKYVLKNSMLHIDCEGGMVHLATQLGTKCIVIFGPTPHKYYSYPVNINIISKKCTNCYWLIDDCFTCYRGMEKPECMYSIMPSKVMGYIEKSLNYKKCC